MLRDEVLARTACRNAILGLLALVVLVLTGCASRGNAPVTPPAVLLEPCSPELLESLPYGTDNKELSTYTIKLRSALRGCNVDKEALRQWKELMEGHTQ